jgi:hypothetical protein
VPAVIETPEDFIGIRQKMFLSHSYDHRRRQALEERLLSVLLNTWKHLMLIETFKKMIACKAQQILKFVGLPL